MSPPQPLQMESMQDDCVIALSCATCATRVDLWTGDRQFEVAVQAFFGRHGRCAASIDLT